MQRPTNLLLEPVDERHVVQITENCFVDKAKWF